MEKAEGQDRCVWVVGGAEGLCEVCQCAHVSAFICILKSRDATTVLERGTLALAPHAATPLHTRTHTPARWNASQLWQFALGADSGQLSSSAAVETWPSFAAHTSALPSCMGPGQTMVKGGMCICVCMRVPHTAGSKSSRPHGHNNALRLHAHSE